MISLPELFLLHTLINDLHINMAVLILVAIKTDPSPNIMRVIKSKKMGARACHAQREDDKCVQNFG
jgi:hypothetical protein